MCKNGLIRILLPNKRSGDWLNVNECPTQKKPCIIIIYLVYKAKELNCETLDTVYIVLY